MQLLAAIDVISFHLGKHRGAGDRRPGLGPVMWKITLARFICACLFAIISGTIAIAGALEDGIAALDASQYRKAYQLFSKDADAGNPEAQVQLATMLLDGLGIGKDRKTAAHWLMQAANREHVYAQYRLGMLLEEGIAAKPDEVAAAQWYERALKHGDPDAAYRLALLYDRGRGVAPNPNRAIALYRQAAAGGVLKAEHAVGSILIQGRKAPADIVEGAMWLELAWRGGDNDVINELKPLRASLTAAQRAAVDARVAAHMRTSRHHYMLK